MGSAPLSRDGSEGGLDVEASQHWGRGRSRGGGRGRSSLYAVEYVTQEASGELRWGRPGHRETVWIRLATEKTMLYLDDGEHDAGRGQESQGRAGCESTPKSHCPRHTANATRHTPSRPEGSPSLRLGPPSAGLLWPSLPS